MQQPSNEERIINALSRIHMAIQGLSHTLDRLSTDWKHPIVDFSEEHEKRWKEQDEAQKRKEEIELLTAENKTLIRTVKVTLFGIIASLVLGIIDIILRIFFNK